MYVTLALLPVYTGMTNRDCSDSFLTLELYRKAYVGKTLKVLKIYNILDGPVNLNTKEL